MRRVLAGLSACAVLAAASTAGAVSPGSWPQFHYSVLHAGVNPNERVLNRTNVRRLRVLWRRHVPKNDFGIVNSSPAVSSNLVFVGNGDGRLYAFRRTTGRLAWKARVSRLSIQSSPAVAGGLVYVGSNDGTVGAFRSATGARVWTIKTSNLGGNGSSSPAVADGVVYIGAQVGLNDGRLYALDARTGALVWQADTLAPVIASSPTVADGHVYVGTGGGNVLVYPTSCTTPCKPLWLYELGEELEVGTPVLADGKVFVSADSPGGSFVFALPQSCGAFVCEPIWRANTLTPFTFSTPAVAGGIVYAQGFRLYAFAEDCGSGGSVCRPLWIGVAKGSSSPAVANGVVYAGSVTGRLYAFPVGCRPVGRICRPLYRGPPTGGSPFAGSPAVVGGSVYYGAFTTMRAFRLPPRDP